MIISDKMKELLDYRIEQEEFSSQLYRAMSVWFDFMGYTYATKLWKKYSEEELVHASWAYEFLLDLNLKPCTPAIAKPQVDFSGVLEIVQLSIDHEKKITSQCNDLAKAALEENDFMTFALAQKYNAEQQEETSKFNNLADMLNTFGTSPEALKLFDNSLEELL
jgi:ferritin